MLRQKTIIVPASAASLGCTSLGPKIMERFAMNPFNSDATVTKSNGKASELKATGSLLSFRLQKRNKGIIRPLKQARIQILSAVITVLA